MNTPSSDALAEALRDLWEQTGDIDGTIVQYKTRQKVIALLAQHDAATAKEEQSEYDLILRFVDALYASPSIQIVGDGCSSEGRDKWILEDILRSASQASPNGGGK